MKSYLGYNCTLCGKWKTEPFKVPTYKSCGRHWDTWQVCDDCIKDAKEAEENEPIQRD